MKSNREKMLGGKLYTAADKELLEARKKCRMFVRIFNKTTEDQYEYRADLIREMFRFTGERVLIEPPFYCDYGSNITVGEDFYANYDCMILDVCEVVIGNHVKLGPRVSIYTAAHPIDYEVRASGLEYGKPVVIEDHVWIGGNTVVNPGVTIGARSVIGAGSVITRDIPRGVVAVGNPCRVLKEIREDDKTFWRDLRDEYSRT